MAASDQQQMQSVPDASDAFVARMQAQCKQIEAYRLDVNRREGRCISLDQAAREWIERYAHEFG